MLSCLYTGTAIWKAGKSNAKGIRAGRVTKVTKGFDSNPRNFAYGFIPCASTGSLVGNKHNSWCFLFLYRLLLLQTLAFSSVCRLCQLNDGKLLQQLQLCRAL